MSPAELTLRRDELTERLDEVRQQLEQAPADDAELSIEQQASHAELIELENATEKQLKAVLQKIAELEKSDND